MSSEIPPTIAASSEEPDAVIDARGLSKSYQIYRRPHDRLKQMLWPGKRKFYRDFWALREIDLQVRRGQTVGIIGRNGSGKSTLLQLICGTLRPTQGTVEIRGRIAALLELGAGFNPEFSGRDNVRLYGSVLGLSARDIDAKMDAILAFAEIGDFIDLPVKTYSSGMYVRLAFSVAINVDPDILIVDEALAVGDGRFQNRCMQRIKQLQDEGVSILYVSHDAEGVKRLCSHVIVLQDGRIVNEGQALHMSNWYVALMTVNYDLEKLRAMELAADARDAVSRPEHAAEAISPTEQAGEPALISNAAPRIPGRGVDLDLPEFKYFRHGDGRARITDIYLSNELGEIIQSATLGDIVTVNIEVAFVEDQHDYIIGLYVTDRHGTNVIGINSYQERVDLPPVRGGDRIVYSWQFPLDVRPGFYSLSPSVAYDQLKLEWLDYVNNAMIFRVIDRDVGRHVFGVYLPPWRRLLYRRLSGEGVSAEAQVATAG